MVKCLLGHSDWCPAVTCPFEVLRKKNDKTSLSAYHVCNGVRDCQGNEDEAYCVDFVNINYPSKICSQVKSAKLNLSEFNCPTSANNKASETSCVDCNRNLSTLTFDFVGPLNNSMDENFPPDKKCIFEPNECDGMDKKDINGKHLISCEDYPCGNEYFKCSGFYCIPWRLVCNDRWDCPGGTDENNCKQKACPGMFKCVNSSICDT